VKRRRWRRAWSTLRAEGLRGLRLRVGERLATLRGAGFAASRDLGPLAKSLGPLPILNVLPFPLRPVQGGVAVTLADRLEVEGEERAIALLSHDGRRWRLDGRRGAHRFAWRAHAARPLAPFDLEDAPFAELLQRVVATLDVRAVHFENLAGLPLETLADFAATTPTLVSTHDFALFCARPNLLEEPEGRFCGYSTDDARCLACLRRSGEVAARHPAARRQAALRLARSARALVHPSRFAERETARLFPGLDASRGVVVPPAVRCRASSTRRASWPPRRVAFVGQAFRHKGILEFEELVATMRPSAPGLAWAIAGQGDPEALERLARLGVERLGAYAPGRLPALLAAARVDLALLCSRFPETHSLALDECIQAGVPVLAAPVGALPERVSEMACGWVADEGPLAPALVRGLEGLLSGERAPLPGPPRQPSTPEASAAAHLALYARLGFAGPPAGRP